MKLTLTILIILVIVAGAWLYFVEFDISNDYTAKTPAQKEQKEKVRGTLPTITLTPRSVTLPDGIQETFNVPEGFNIAIAEEGLGKARFIARSPDNRLFIPDLVNYSLSHEGSITILSDFDKEAKQFKKKDIYLSNLRGPNSVAFYTDENGNDWIYIALTAHLIRYPYTKGATAPSTKPEIVFEFPNTQSPEAKSVVWHITRTLLFHDGQLYISIGSGCNSCEHLDNDLRGMVMVMNPDGSDAHVYADGLRNAVGIAWAENSLYATANGVDHLGPTAPDELMYKITEEQHYAWPYCYESDGELVPDNSTIWRKQVSCENAPHSLTAFPPHSAPLGLTYFDNAHKILEGSFLVALHGSFDEDVRSGNSIVRVDPRDGSQEIFIDGFLKDDNSRSARPVDFLQWDKNSFFFTDDAGGRLYYVYAE